MLVYLDSSHIAWLESADPPVAGEFFDMWRQHGHTLALSFHHLQEIGQLRDAASVDTRFAVLAEFPTVVGGLTTAVALLDIEILELLTSGSLNPDRVRTQVFSPNPIAGLHAIVTDLQPVFHEMREGLLLAAEAEGWSQQARVGPRPSMRKRINPEDVGRILPDVDVLLPDGPARDTSRGVIGSFVKNLREAGTPRSALRQTLGIPRQGPGSLVPNADVPMASIFYGRARVLASKLVAAGIITQPADAAAEALDIYLAPGYRLKMSVNRGRSLDTTQPHAGDQIDQEHAMFAPYVDLWFGDARTCHYAAQEYPKHSHTQHDYVITRIKTVANLQELIATLRIAAVSS